jgi:hypothetical protein
MLLVSAGGAGPAGELQLGGHVAAAAGGVHTQKHQHVFWVAARWPRILLQAAVQAGVAVAGIKALPLGIGLCSVTRKSNSTEDNDRNQNVGRWGGGGGGRDRLEESWKSTQKHHSTKALQSESSATCHLTSPRHCCDCELQALIDSPVSCRISEPLHTQVQLLDGREGHPFPVHGWHLDRPSGCQAEELATNADNAIQCSS